MNAIKTAFLMVHRVDTQFWFPLFLMVPVVLGLHYFARMLANVHPFLGPSLDQGGGFQLDRSWAQYSPYFEAAPYRDLPSGCEVEQANIIQRHGARYPTDGAAEDILAALNKLLAVETYTSPELEFLSTYSYNLGIADLVPFGAHEAYTSGAQTFDRYSHLVAEDHLPFVRASGSTRVIDSANNWTTGFAAASNHIYQPYLTVILDEAGNDTLDDHLCPNAGDSDVQVDIWQSTYTPPIAARINERTIPSANLGKTDIYSLMALCPFDTLSSDPVELSPFCNLFTEEEFKDFSYAGAIDKYYNTGPGQPLGPVQGVGYINELLARLTRSPVQDETQTNRTLDSDPKTFPLDRSIYVDFSHDNAMIPVYVAMGLFKQEEPLDPTKRQSDDATWKVEKMVPFSGRMVTELVSCDAQQFVRVLVSNVVQPLEFCGAESEGKWAGLCTLEKFVESQGYARENGRGDFEKCFN